jgi:hypothetical protein
MQDRLHDLEGYEVLVCRESDLVMLDIVIGREAVGWRVLSLLTLDPAPRPIPVLVCSATVPSLRPQRRRAALDGYRDGPKPFALDALLSAIERTLARHHAGDHQDPGPYNRGGSAQ